MKVWHAKTLEVELSGTTSTTGALDSVKIGDKVAVKQVLTFANGNRVESAVKVATVK